MAIRFGPPKGASLISIQSFIRGPSGLQGDPGADGAGYGGTSNTSLSIVASGSITFDIEPGLAYQGGSRVRLSMQSDPSHWMEGAVTNYINGSMTVAVDAARGSGLSTAWNLSLIGRPGAPLGVVLEFDAATVVGPSNGQFRFNTADPALATEMYVSKTDFNGYDIGAFLLSLDDSTNAMEGYIYTRGVTLGSTFSIHKITGVSDGGFFVVIQIQYMSGGGAFNDSGLFALSFGPSGDKGANGLGTGDVVGPSSAVSGEVAIYNGTTGKLIGRLTGSAAVAKVVNGALASASPSVDYLPPVSGTAIMKGNGSGGLTAASAGTDYQAPDPTLDAIRSMTGTGLVARTAEGAVAARAVAVADANHLAIANGDGVAGNPTLSLGPKALKSDTSVSLEVGYPQSIKALVPASNAISILIASGGMQSVDRTASTLTVNAPTNAGVVILQMVNTVANPGAVTFAGFEKALTGDAFDATLGSVFWVFIYSFGTGRRAYQIKKII